MMVNNELLQATGLQLHELLEEVLWLQFNGIDVTRLRGRERYIKTSRAGRGFAMNRKQRLALCAYVDRVTDVAVTNVECYHLKNSSNT